MSCYKVHLNFRIEQSTENVDKPWKVDFDFHIFRYQDIHNQECLYIWEKKHLGDVVDVCVGDIIDAIKRFIYMFRTIDKLRIIWTKLSLIDSAEIEGIVAEIIVDAVVVIP